jgi:hypothetical protein
MTHEPSTGTRNSASYPAGQNGSRQDPNFDAINDRFPYTLTTAIESRGADALGAGK